MHTRKRNVNKQVENNDKKDDKLPRDRLREPQTLTFKFFKVIILALPILFFTYFLVTLDFGKDKSGTESLPILEKREAKEVNIPEDVKGKENSEKKSEKTPSPVPKPAEKFTDGPDEKLRKHSQEIVDLLRNADRLLNEKKLDEAMKAYEEVLVQHPQDPMARYGRYETLNALAEAKRSNKYLEKAIEECKKFLDLPNVPKTLMLKGGRSCADRQKFRGWNDEALKTYEKLFHLYPSEIHLSNEAGVAGLLANKVQAARKFFQITLRKDPDNGFAKVHIGFIMKTTDNDIPGAIPFLEAGIASKAEGTQDGRFFFHLGDAYYRDGQHAKAYEIYDHGAKIGLFRSKWQRSLYNVDRLESRPWWTYEQTGHADMLRKLEKNWKVIRDEGMAQLDASGAFSSEEENLREKGDWKQLNLYARGRQDEGNCRRTPKTCALLSEFVDATSCTRGQIKFSVMHAGVHVWPHCGPTNCRIRAHLGLVIPEGPIIRVADQMHSWKEGKFIIFDDSFEHEVWHNGTDTRLVLIVDIWHPQLSAHEKKTLSPI